MRNNVLNLMVLCLAFILILPSCVSKKKFDQMVNDKESIDKMLTEQRQKVASLEGDVENLTTAKGELEAQNADLNSKLSGLQNDLAAAEKNLNMTKKGADEKDAKISSMTAAIKATFAAYKNAGLSVNEKDNRLYVNIGEPILYKSGSTRVRKEHKESIMKLAEVLKNNPSLIIQVEGHTDSKKMINGARYMDNLELSAARAMSIVRMLVKNGVPESQVSAVGRGDKMPVNTEDTAEARDQNRRAEFVIIPQISELHKLANSAGV
ncbi:MAG: OmpA family protein [Bacteroidota bacterium]